MPQVQMWKTSDGKIFDNEKEHDEHESRLKDVAIVEEFLSFQKWANKAQESKARNTLMAFLDWQNRGAVVVDITSEKTISA